MTAQDSSDGVPLHHGYENLRSQYLRERSRRLRPDTNDQYRATSGALAHFAADPRNRQSKRIACATNVDIAIIGGGFGGLLLAARLVEAGIGDFVLIDKAADFGGTWYWNQYPGARCDVDSLVYLPLLEEMGYIPTERYAGAREIYGHCRAIASRYELYERALLSTAVTSCDWNEQAGVWRLATDMGDAISTRFVYVATGPLHRPKLPGIPGIETFRGVSFHTARWNYGYTSGDCSGNLDGLHGKVVGIIGTGASAVQCIPHVAESAKQLYVFQRTPSQVEPLNNSPLQPDQIDRSRGWHRERMERYNNYFAGADIRLPLSVDGWATIIDDLLDRSISHVQNEACPPEVAVERADFDRMQSLHAHIDSIVDDRSTADALKPFYRHFCKRPCFSDDYYPTFNRPNVSLVDTSSDGIDEIDERGVIIASRHYALDCLIFATGFEVGTHLPRRLGFDIIGKDGARLSERWESQPSTLHGIASHGFPNCFVVRTAQAAATLSYPHFLDEVSRHIAFIMSEALRLSIDVVEVNAAAETAWVAQIVGQADYERTVLSGCTPGYHNFEGQDRANSAYFNTFQGGSPKFFELLRNWRDQHAFDGLDITTQHHLEFNT